jgi:hypothetical protein
MWGARKPKIRNPVSRTASKFLRLGLRPTRFIPSSVQGINFALILPCQSQISRNRKERLIQLKPPHSAESDGFSLGAQRQANEEDYSTTTTMASPGPKPQATVKLSFPLKFGQHHLMTSY